MLLRGLSGCTSLFFRYSSVTYISLADTTIILLSMPVFVFIFARIFLGEQFGRFHVLALVLSIVGIAFASKIEFLFGSAEKALNSTMIPESLFNSTTTTTMTTTTLASTTVASNVVHNGATSSYNQLIGSLYACGAMVVGSLVYVMVRKV